MRARATIEESKKSGRESIVVSEIPYYVNKSRLIENLGEHETDGLLRRCGKEW